MLTIGHSNRPLEEFLDLLKAHRVQLLADVRTVPRSSRNPQFNRESLPPPLAAAGILYEHIPGMGGLRHAGKDSTNTGWRNPGFRGYADHMQTDEFQRSLEELVVLESGRRTAIMCAESVPWRCHRSLIADALTVRGIAVEHIMSPTKVNAHILTSFARVEGGRVTYPGPNLELFRR